MEGNQCLKHDEHERRITTLEKHCDEFRTRFNELDKDFAVTKETMAQSIENLSKLPETLDRMAVSMNALQISLNDNNIKTDSLGRKVDKLESKVDTINEEGKFNIRKYIRDNWVAILIGIGGIVAAGSQLIK